MTDEPTTPPAYTAPPAAPYVEPAVVRPAGSPRLGIIALVAAVAAVVIGSILVFIGAQILGGLVEYTGTSGRVTTLPPEAEGPAATGGILLVLGYIVASLLALWGFIQGIVAIVKKRGRGWGVAALIIAVLAVGIVSIFFGIGFASTAAPYLSTVS